MSHSVAGRNKIKFKVLFYLCLTLFFIHIVNIFSHYQLVQYGISPRNIGSLPFILTAPFIHGNFVHLINNILLLVVLSGLCLMKSYRFFLWNSLIIIFLSGLMVWAFGRSSYHIGASGWIFGLWSLCIAIAWFDRSVWNFLLALFVLIFYGGMIVGVLPSDPRISFEYHLFGALAGIVAAAFSAKKKFEQ